MSFISLWVGHIEPPDKLPAHLQVIYGALGTSTFRRDPEVCAERERVPVAELLEPFSLGELLLSGAVAAAERQGLRLANTVVAVYTHYAPKAEGFDSTGCDLHFIGTFTDAQQSD